LLGPKYRALVNMGFISRFRKKQMPEDLGKFLLSIAVTTAEPFLDEDLPEISEDLGVDLNDYDQNVLRSEILMVCLWAATKALEGDNQVIKMIHDAFFSAFEGKRRNELKEMFSQRYKRYNEAWDESSRGMQLVLATNILSEMFNEGEINESLLDIFVILCLNK